MSVGLIVGIPGPKLDDDSRRVLMHPGVVGVILFSRNYESPEQLLGLADELRALRDPRLLLCVDQEGGRVQRFRDGFTRLPALAAIGRWHGRHPERALDLAYRHGRVMAAEVLGHGVDLSLAPVLDLHRGSRVIGDRSFGADPRSVADLAAHYLAGMRDAGMKNCGKHFPGHGSVGGDTHDETVVDDRAREDIDIDIAPFARLADQLDAVMPAHVRFERVDARPAGFSRVWVEDILRGELGFSGTVISDDLDMAGAATGGEIGERLAWCGTAGCDLALVCDPSSAAAAVEGLEADPDAYAKARRAAADLMGRASFSLSEQELVPEFRAWKRSLDKMAGDQRD